jgi:hypothetical protein
MGHVVALISVVIVFGLPCEVTAQRCGLQSSEHPGNAKPEQIARANVDVLFEGIALTEEETKRAVAIFTEAWNVLVRLDYRAPDYRERFTESLTERNRKLMALAKSIADTTRLATCFKKMGQPVPTRAPGHARDSSDGFLMRRTS